MNILNRIAALVISVFALNVFVSAQSGYVGLPTDADSKNTYLISTDEEFAEFVDLVNSGMTNISCRLMDDVNYTGGMIATNGAFEGTFDGNFFTLNVSVVASSQSGFVALFKELGSGAVIKNLTLKGTISSSSPRIAGLAGRILRNDAEENGDEYAVNIERCVVDLSLVNTGASSIGKVYSGVVGIADNCGIYVINNVGFFGSYEGEDTSGECLICGLVGRDNNEAFESISVKGFLTWANIDNLQSNYTVYKPLGDLYTYDGEYPINASRCIFMPLDVDEIDKREYGSSVRNGKNSDFSQTGLVSRSLSTVWERKDGSPYPTIIIPTAIYNGAWSVKPSVSHNVVFESDASINSDFSCRVLTVNSGCTITVTPTSNSQLLKLSAQSLVLNGVLNVRNNTSVVTKDIDAGDQHLVLEYDASDPKVTRVPSLKYLGNFTGAAKFVRTVVGKRYYYMGSATKERKLNNLSATMLLWAYNPSNATWADKSSGMQQLKSGSLLSGDDITAPQLLGLNCSGAGVITQVGTPLEARPISVTTPKSGTVMYTNPYPYTVDLNDDGGYYSSVKGQIGNTLWVRSLDVSTLKYNTATIDISNGTAVNASATLFPFQDVSYHALKKGVSFNLPYKMASVPSVIKSATLSSVRRDYFSFAVYTNGSTLPSDEVALIFKDGGLMVAETDNLDSKVYRKYQNQNNIQEISQLFLHKPYSSDSLAIAVYPEVNQMLDVKLPFTILKMEGASSLSIEPLANFDAFEAQVDVYLYDDYTKEMVNLGKNPKYNVPDIDNLSDDRFAIILKSKSSTLTSIPDVNVEPKANVYVAGSKVIVDVPENFVGQNIDIYNTFGNKVLSLPAEKHNAVNVPQSGIYIVVVNGVKSKVSVK